MERLKNTKQLQRSPPVGDQVFAVSGSCSATTEDQIATAEAHGFQIINFDVSTVTQPKRFAAELERVRNESLIKLSKNYDVLVATARGPDDLMIKRMEEAVNKTTPDECCNERQEALPANWYLTSGALQT